MKITQKVIAEKAKFKEYQYSMLCSLKDGGSDAIAIIIDVLDNGDGPPDNLYYSVSFGFDCYSRHSSSFQLGTEGLQSLRDTFGAIYDAIDVRHRLERLILPSKGEAT